LEALERLTARQRAAFHLRAVEGMEYRAIGESLDCTAVAARMLVLGARRKVMARVGRYLEP
jgi:DNA-directed RNA polymerase specialized sigma24 family protein